MSLQLVQVLPSGFGVIAFSYTTTQKLFNAIPQASENGCKTLLDFDLSKA
jgi:hypothetical protein